MNILSSIRSISFNFKGFVIIISSLWFTAFGISGSQNTPVDQSTGGLNDRIFLNITTGYRVPLSHSADIWGSYPFTGFFLDLPTYINNTQFRVSADAGLMSSVPKYNIDVLIIHGTAACLYNFSIISEKLLIKPFAGVSNTMVYVHDKFKFDADIFGTSENEFGISAGIDLALTRKMIRISVPIYADYVFSAPIPFVTFSIAIAGGIGFR